MTNVLKRAINCDDSERAAEIIIDALGIESDELASFCLKHWPSERKQRAGIIGHWLHAEAQFLGASSRRPREDTTRNNDSLPKIEIAQSSLRDRLNALATGLRGGLVETGTVTHSPCPEAVPVSKIYCECAV
jgi:hypothetical protein